MTALAQSRFSETKFSESFWSNSRGDYVHGANVLHAKVDQGAVEDQEILTYLRERIEVEQRYGNALIEMGNRRLKVRRHRHSFNFLASSFLPSTLSVVVTA